MPQYIPQYIPQCYFYNFLGPREIDMIGKFSLSHTSVNQSKVLKSSIMRRNFKNKMKTRNCFI